MGSGGGDRDPLDGLDAEQSAAVGAPRGPVCVLAGAGTGKTRTITRRIAQLIRTGHVAPSQVLAVTFTTRAAGEMRTRLCDLAVDGVQARTFHAAALRQLRYFWPRVVGEQLWPLLKHKLRLIGQAAQQAGPGTGADLGADDLRDVAGEIEWAKASLVSAADYPAAVATARRATPVPAAQVAAIYAGYEELKNRNRVLDFDDLLLHTVAVLDEYSAVAQEFRDRYRCFVVDEYQDITPLQQRVLDAWLGERDDLTVVGDTNQTIYSFAGAAPRFLLDFTRRFPEAVLVRLYRDYRSTPQVVSLANRVISAAGARPAGARLLLEGQRSAGPQPSFAEYDDELTEADAVAAAIEQLLRDGTPAAEIAVLYRVNAQSEVYEQALAARGILFQVRSGERFAHRPEVPSEVQGVTLASLHSAKGLEWDAVFLVGLVEGTLPIQYAEGDQATLAEERRLLYVGVTRARRRLALSWALSRGAGGRRSRCRSRFLDGLVPRKVVAGVSAGP